jgi:hypothetical protein
MVLVRIVIQAQPRQAGEIANLYKENLGTVKKMWGQDLPVRILTDLSGPFDTVVLEITVDRLATWEKIRANMFASPEFAEAIERNPSVSYQSGRTEFYTIEAEG